MVLNGMLGYPNIMLVDWIHFCFGRVEPEIADRLIDAGHFSFILGESKIQYTSSLFVGAHGLDGLVPPAPVSGSARPEGHAVPLPPSRRLVADVRVSMENVGESREVEVADSVPAPGRSDPGLLLAASESPRVCSYEIDPAVVIDSLEPLRVDLHFDHMPTFLDQRQIKVVCVLAGNLLTPERS
jgi:hypothetical protein